MLTFEDELGPEYSYSFLKDVFEATDEKCLHYQGVGRLRAERKINMIQESFLVRLIEFSDENLEYKAGFDFIAQKNGISRETASRYAKKLEAKGYLKIIRGMPCSIIKITVPINEEHKNLGLPEVIFKEIALSISEKMQDFEWFDVYVAYNKTVQLAIMLLSRAIVDFERRAPREIYEMAEHKNLVSEISNLVDFITITVKNHVDELFSGIAAQQPLPEIKKTCDNSNSH